MKGDGKINGGASRRQRIALACAALVAGSMCASGARAAESLQDVGTAGLERFQLHGSGTTNPSKLFWYAMDLLEERAGAFVRMTYRAVGSGTGRDDWISADAADFASTEFGLSSAVSGGTVNDYLQLPFQIGAIGIFHTVPGYGSGELKISACTLAKIYTGANTMWDDPDIKADTGITLPTEKIHVVFRSDGSSSTYGLKGYLNAGCPTVYTGTVSSSSFSSALSGDTYHGVQGSDGVRREIASRANSIGYLDAGHGHADDLAEFSLKNTADEWLVTKEGNPAGITSANIPSVVTTAVQTAYTTAGFSGDLTGASYNLFNKAGSGVWPICAFTYLHVRKVYSSGETAALVRAFVSFILSDEIQAAVNKFYFFPLDTTFLASVRSAASAGITPTATSSSVTDWTFETSTIAATATSMGVKTFSKKRQAYVDYALELLNATVTDLETSVAALEADSHEAPSLKPLTGLAAFDFVVAFAALIIGSIALHKARSNGRIGGGLSNYVVGP